MIKKKGLLNISASIAPRKMKHSSLDSSHRDGSNGGGFILLGAIDAKKSDENCIKFKNFDLYYIDLDQIRLYSDSDRIRSDRIKSDSDRIGSDFFRIWIGSDLIIFRFGSDRFRFYSDLDRIGSDFIQIRIGSDQIGSDFIKIRSDQILDKSDPI